MERNIEKRYRRKTRFQHLGFSMDLRRYDQSWLLPYAGCKFNLKHRY